MKTYTIRYTPDTDCVTLDGVEKRTCYKCKHYHACLSDGDYSVYDFCDFWKKSIPGGNGIVDDVDAEVAVCWKYTTAKLEGSFKDEV